MFAVVITEKGGAQRRMDFDKNEVTIGRVQGNDIVLPKGNVSKRHSRIVLKDGRFIVVDLKSTNGTYVNGRKITSPLVVKTGDKIYIGDFIMTLEEGGAADAPAPQAAPPQPAAPQAAPPQAASRPGPPPLRPAAGAPSQPPPPPQHAPPPLPSHPEPAPAAAPAQATPAAPPSAAPVSEPPGDSFGLGQEPAQDAPAPAPESRPTAPPKSRPRVSTAQQSREAQPQAASPKPSGSAFASLMGRLAVSFPVADTSASAMHDSERWSRAGDAINAALAAMASSEGFGGASRDDLSTMALKEAVGLGALDSLVADENIAEIVVEGPGRVLADSGEGLELTGAGFSSAAALQVVALRLLGGDDGSGSVRHATLAGGAHATVILPPVAVGGPVIEIRRGRRSAGLDALITRGMLDRGMADLLTRAVTVQQNIVVLGPAASGVSTVLGALASAIAEGERVVLVEGQPDIRLDRAQAVALHAAGSETVGGLARQASSLRCDRLVVDDVGAPDTLIVLQVMASRGEGAMAGFHAASGDDPFATMKALTGESGLDDLLASGVDIVVRTGREGDTRRIVEVIEVTGVDAGVVQTQSLYEFTDSFESTGATPGF